MVIKMILVVFGLMIIGFIKEFTSLVQAGKDFDFLVNYNETYVKYLNNYRGRHTNSNEENELHVKLISDAPKAQRLLMGAGLVDFQPPFAGYMIKNYPILVNTVKSIRNSSLVTSEELEWLNTILIMQISQFKEFGEGIKKNLINPLILLREGIQFFTTLPISLLYWTGLIQYSTQYKLTNNIIVKCINFLIIILGFVSAIFTIVLGWEPFKELLRNIL